MFLKKYQSTFEKRSGSGPVKGSFFKYENDYSPNLFDPRLRSSPKSQIEVAPRVPSGSLPVTINSESQENLFLTKEQRRYLNKHNKQNSQLELQLKNSKSNENLGQFPYLQEKSSSFPQSTMFRQSSNPRLPRQPHLSPYEGLFNLQVR